MSKRISKREAREQEALAALQSDLVAKKPSPAPAPEPMQGSDEDDEPSPPAPPVGGFAALSLLEDENEEKDEDAVDDADVSAEPLAPKSKSKKSRKKKKKNKGALSTDFAAATATAAADTAAAADAVAASEKPGPGGRVGKDDGDDDNNNNNDDDDDDDEEENFADAIDHDARDVASEQTDDGKPKPDSQTTPLPSPPQTSTAGSSNKSKKKASKAKKAPANKKTGGKNKPPKKSADDMTMEELDSVLAEAKAKDPPPPPPEPEEGKDALWKYFVQSNVTDAEIAAIEAFKPLQTHLACQARNFDPQAELTRSFGAAAVRAYHAHDERQGPSGRAGVSAAQAAMEKRYFTGILNQNKRYRSILVQPQYGWPLFQGRSAGLLMTEFDTLLGKRYSWLWSHQYKALELEFIAAMHSVDPSQLYQLIGKYPWHIHALMQLSEIGRMQGDLGLRTSSLEKALYAMERATTPSFHGGLTSGQGVPKVTYRSPESRAFFLAAHKYVNCLTYKGTWRTALEWAKLVLGLEPEDPHCMRLWIDFLAIKTDSCDWFLTLCEIYEKVDDMGWNPGWHYSKALAYRLAHASATATASASGRDKDKDKDKDAYASAQAVADSLLDQAIQGHPLVAALLLQKNGVDAPCAALGTEHSSLTAVKDPAELAEEDGGLVEQLLAHVYAHRMLPLWKESRHATWLAQRLDRAYPPGDSTLDERSFHPYAQDPPDEAAQEKVLHAVLTHLTVSDFPEEMHRLFKALVPRGLQPQQNILGELDPYPPAGTEMSERFFLP